MTDKIKKTMEYLFYLLVLLFYVGKVFKAITFLIDILFIFMLIKDTGIAKNLFSKYKDYHYYTFKSSFETILYIVSFFAALYIFDDKQKIKRLIFVSLTAVSIVSFDAIYQYFVGKDIFGNPLFNDIRITAWSDRPSLSLMMGEFGGLLIASLILLKGKQRKIAFLVFALFIFVMVMSGNRSPILALASSIFIVGIFSRYRVYVIGTLIAFFLLFVLAFLNPGLKERYNILFDLTANKNTSGRLPIYLTGYEIIKDHPIFGIGSHNYKLYHPQYYDTIVAKKYKQYYVQHFSKYTPNHVHSVFIDMILSYGIVGCLIFLYILWLIYKRFIRKNEIGLLASIGFLYCITPLQFARSFTIGDAQFITYLGLIFLALMSTYNNFIQQDVGGENANI
ncbi:MAG: oligosaccharide repeat unit polymerase [Sulfurovaceae bacterium]